MNKTFALDNFDLATATIAVIDNQILQTLELYLYDCNALFTELTELKPDKKNDVSEKAFGKKKQEYLSDLLKLSRTGLKEIFIFRIQKLPGIQPIRQKISDRGSRSFTLMTKKKLKSSLWKCMIRWDFRESWNTG
jgi:hypothetical protein